MDNNSVFFVTEDGENIEFNIIDETKLNGISYILVTDSPQDESGDCYIMKDISSEDEEEANYIFVEDENELNAVFEIFEKMMDEDIEIIK
ncbi:DUF1292 domain-containing protein [Lachnoanaerobaculum umeaense]|jgi:hypothetical protein|uniref:DUF1292 domain-containing protein n=1 Tax=Lachnoanaerobaculum umeaense TaxID=617123 RepID=A0A385PXV1_9FIRM|nr:DUF1292 domain-containing protein [Lachnoanaerobaculum umeaense]AYA98930.1 DUF1292 domain-containing protein [Lachnoanaerobaculum umeaense]PZW94981.1 uncharacterized protein DUF1292 [Lachnoanaerobaculum umeaense]